MICDNDNLKAQTILEKHTRVDRRAFLKAGLGAVAGAIVGQRTVPLVAGFTSDALVPRNWTKGENKAEHKAWLAQVTEEPMAPELPICDPHHHLWNWPGHFLHYLLEDLLRDAKGHNVVSTVFVECSSSYRPEGPQEMRPVGETEFVEGIAAGCAADSACPTAVAAGIVGHADLRLGERVAPVLEAHLAASPERFRGIRHICAWHPSQEPPPAYMNPPEGLMRNSAFRKGLACLLKHGLSFDSWAYFTQLGEVADLARAFPNLTIICDHLGGVMGIGPYTGKWDEVLAQWKGGIKELAACPNVFMKLGGLAMTLSGFGWHERAQPPGSRRLAEATAPYIRFAIESFGVRRCMFESNFPVDKVSCSYRVLWNSFKRVVNDFSQDEKAHLFHDTAAKVYKIKRAR